MHTNMPHTQLCFYTKIVPHFTYRRYTHKTLLHTETLLHIKPFWTQRLFDTGSFTHKPFYTHLYAQSPFTHKHFYTQTLLHTDPFAHKHFYTQALSHTDAFAHRLFDTHTNPPSHTQTRLHTNHVANNYIQSLLHTNAFTHQRFCTQTLCTETLYTQTL